MKEIEHDGYGPDNGYKFPVQEGFPSTCLPGGHNWRLIEASIQPFDLNYGTTDWYCVTCRRIERVSRSA